MVNLPTFEKLRSDRLNGYAIVPMLTPIHKDGSLDETSISRLIAHILEGGCQGIMVSGTTGEALSMDLDLRLEILKLAHKFMEDCGLLLFGVSDNSFTQSVALANAGFALGCDAVVAHVPFCYPMSEAEIEAWFLKLAERIQGPMFVYNIPQTTGVSIPVRVLERLSRYPTIVGLKDSERDLDRQLELARMFSDRRDFAFFTGCIGEGSGIMRAGARGYVPAAGNLCPSLAHEIMNAHLDGDYPTMDRLLQRLLEIVAVFQTGGNVAEALCSMKAAASLFDLCEPYVLPPLPKIEDQRLNNLRRAFEGLNLLTPKQEVS